MIVTTGQRFRLPAAWRHRSEFEPPETVNEVDLEFDVATAMGTHALLAAHLRVLGVLTDQVHAATEVVFGAGAQPVEVEIDPGVTGTWRAAIARARTFEREAAASTAPDPDELADSVLFLAAGAQAPPSRAYGLTVSVTQAGTVRLHAGEGVLSASALHRLARIYRHVICLITADPEGSTAVDCLPEAEREPVLVHWSRGAQLMSGTDTTLDLFRRQAQRTPDAVAVTAVDGRLTYRELDELSDRMAARLLVRGADPQVPVGVCLRRGVHLLPTLLGVWKTGAPYLPLDPGLPALRAAHMIETVRCELVVTRREHEPVVTGRRLVLLDEPEVTEPFVAARPAALTAAHPAYIMFTSGSTGSPKGVMVHHGGLVNYLIWAVENYVARGQYGSPYFTSIGFDLGVPSLFAPLLTGQRVHLLPDPFDPADLGALLVAGGPYSFVKLTPGHLSLLALDLDPDQIAGLAGLVIGAGDAFPADLARRWAKAAGPGKLATEYGPTEITVGNSGALIADEAAEDGLIPLGEPIPGTTMYVLSDELLPLPEGVPGEIYVGGRGVSCGYVGDSARTAQRYLPDPYGDPGSRLYRTGDRGVWRGGRLEFLGRTDHQVKIRGYRVELGEIAEALRRHPDVEQALVLLCEQPTRLVAFVIVAPDRATIVDTGALAAWLGKVLPAYMVPAEYVAVEQFPLTANGKLDTAAIRALAQRTGSERTPTQPAEGRTSR